MDVEDSASDNEITDDDPMVHWKRCEESQRKRMKVMREEKEKIQKEIDTMNSVVAAATNISDDDIIKINAGGKIISVLRSTLCLVATGTMFSYMFSGRWEESLKRDDNGCVFLNHDPELIELIVNFLRTKAIEDPSSDKVKESPTIPEGKEYAFRVLLNYFGLTDFFYPPPVFLLLDINNIDVIQPTGINVTVTKTEDKIQFSKSTNNGAYSFVACQPPLDSSGDGSFWKVKIDELPGDWLFLGIIGNLAASDSSYADPTNYGWSSDFTSYHGGDTRERVGEWTNFIQQECLYFHLKANKLTMFSVQKNKMFTMDIATIVGAYYIHFNSHYIGTKWAIEPLGEEECSRFL